MVASQPAQGHQLYRPGNFNNNAIGMNQNQLMQFASPPSSGQEINSGRQLLPTSVSHAALLNNSGSTPNHGMATPMSPDGGLMDH